MLIEDPKPKKEAVFSLSHWNHLEEKTLWINKNYYNGSIDLYFYNS